MFQLVDLCYRRYILASEQLNTSLPKHDPRVHLAVFITSVYGPQPNDVKAILYDQIARTAIRKGDPAAM